MLPRLGTLLALLLLAAGCADALSLMTLRRSLTKEFHEDDIGVSLTDGLTLTVTFFNQPAAGAACDSLAAFALRGAASVRRNYQGFDSLHTVSRLWTARTIRLREGNDFPPSLPLQPLRASDRASRG